jgi:arginine deiminase
MLMATACSGADGDVRHELVQAAADWSGARLAAVLLRGITEDELRQGTSELHAAHPGPSPFVLPPLPNALFQRDLAAWVGDLAVLAEPALPARLGERALSSVLHAGVATWRDRTLDVDGGVGPANLEGGDVAVLAPGVVAVGVSERTTWAGATALAESLFRNAAASRVIVGQLPRARRFMHLDTVFTMADVDTAVAFEPVVAPMRAVSLRPGGRRGAVEVRPEVSFVDAVAVALGVRRLRLVGGACEAEQRTCGYNVVALRPGVVVAYAHNSRVNDALDRAGIEVVPTPGTELVKAGGGPHCMTRPLVRAES